MYDGLSGEALKRAPVKSREHEVFNRSNAPAGVVLVRCRQFHDDYEVNGEAGEGFLGHGNMIPNVAPFRPRTAPDTVRQGQR